MKYQTNEQRPPVNKAEVVLVRILEMSPPSSPTTSYNDDDEEEGEVLVVSPSVYRVY